jgi:hypothetical protein
MSQPGNSDAVSDPMGIHIPADEVNAADNLMTWYDRISDLRKLSIDNVKVGSANSTCADLDADLSFAWKRIGSFLELQR